MTTQTEKPGLDLDYSIDDFIASADRDSQYFYKALEDLMLRLATAAPGGRVLDVAGGTAKQATRIAQRGCYAVCAEASAEMMGVGRWLMPDSEARLVRAIAEELPFADATFDRVICQGSLDHFADARAFMQEAARITRPDGRVVIALANFESLACRVGRAVDRAKRALRRPRPPWRLYWQVPEDHNVKGDLPYVRALGGQELALEAVWGMSLLWLVPAYGKLLNRLPEPLARRVWQGLDAIGRRRPQDADMIISVWRRR